jgi:uncharacterized membrane protein
MPDEGIDHELDTKRIESLSDCVFAFAMTLLISGFQIIWAQPHNYTNSELSQVLFNIWPDFIHYIIGFVLLGVFWIEHHHQFHFIKHANTQLLFLNIVGLMSITLIPLTTVIVGDYGSLQIAALIFECNLLLAGLIMYVHWVYVAGKHNLTGGELDRPIIQFYKKRNLVIPVISLAAICMSLINPRAGPIFYFTVPLILVWYKLRRHPYHQHKK